MKKLVLVFFYNFLFINFCISQITLKGFVKDTANRPIGLANVCLYKTNSDAILSYSITNDSGQYEILVPKITDSDSFYLCANALGYLTQKILIKTFSKNQNFILTSTKILLPEVIIKSNSSSIVKAIGDTISYFVDSLSSIQDRSIGDVLKKMPGIDIDENGKISYLGKPISNFYIDGDDLLNDRYNIATKAIPSRIVDKVQVIENHQPINILKNSFKSDKIALNLSLKEEARIQFAYNMQIGKGLNKIFDNLLDIMSFKKFYKAINSIKFNNNGIDVRDDITSHNINDLIKQAENDIPLDLLNLNNSGIPPLPKHRYIFNNGKLFNSNNLYNTKSGIHLKANFYYLKDVQNFDFDNNISYFLSDTLIFKELQKTSKISDAFNGNFTININNKKIYFNNSIKFESINNSGQSNSIVNGFGSSQFLNQNSSSFANEFNLIKTNNKKYIIELYSYVYWLRKPESLSINPGSNEEIFNHNIPYSSLKQRNDIPTTFINNYLSVKKNIKFITFSYKAGVLYQHQSLQTSIDVTQINNLITKTGDSLNNDLSWYKYKIYFQTDYDFKIAKYQFGFSLPVSWQDFKYFDILGGYQSKMARPFFTPTLKLRIQTGSESNISWLYNYNTTIANVESVYKGFVLVNYRLLNRSQIDFQQSFSHNINIAYNYRKAIKILFANLSLSYSRNENNTISETELTKNINIKNLRPYNYQIDNIILSGGISKFFFKIKSLISVRSSFQINNSIQIQNNILLNYQNVSSINTINFNSKIFNWLNINYNLRQSINSSINLSNKALAPQKTNTFLHSLDLNLKCSNDLLITLKSELNRVHFNGSITSNLFSDALITYKINKWKMDFSLSMVNITNEDQYLLPAVSANMISQSNFKIRPRSMIAYVLFNF